MHLDNSDGTWFLRFGLDEAHTVLAAGTKNGRVLVYEAHPRQPAVWMGPLPRGGLGGGPGGGGGGGGGAPSRPPSGAGGGVNGAAPAPPHPPPPAPPHGGGGGPSGLTAADFGAPAQPRRRLRCVRPGAPASEDGPLVRQVAVSADGKNIIAACEDGTVWRFGRTRE